MTTQPYPLPGQTALPARAQATPAQNIVTLLVGTWLMIGIFVDGWAHNHLGERLETFFTPWHAVFYSGFAATAGWTGWLGLQGVRQGQRRLAAFPVGYELGAVGVLVFLLGGLGDMTWHTLFGIEVGIDALLSPTHLLLFLGAELLVLSPLLACWQTPTGRQAPARIVWPAVCSALAALSFASFMHMYAWTLVSLPSAAGYQGARSLVMSTLLTSLLLTAPVLLLLLRWHLPFGAVGLVYGLNTLLMFAATVGLSEMLPKVAGLALLSGLAADALIQWWRPAPRRPWAYRAFAAALPLLLWVPFFVGARRLGLLDASLELWTGACVMAALGGLALSGLMVPPAVPREAEE